MTELTDPAKIKARATYNLAADHYDDPVLGFWQTTARGTLARAALRPGEVVLDVCCGSGSTAVPAAQTVGPRGRVIGVDFAERLLELAHAKASMLGLDNVEFTCADMAELAYSDESFDAVICQLGIFFVTDMEAQVAKLWRLVKPGGRLVITTFGPGFLAPVYDVWLDAVRGARPDLDSAFNPWDRITDPESMRRLLLDGGTSEPETETENHLIELETPEDWWKIALGSGLRWTVEQLGPEAAARVQERTIAWLRDNDVKALQWNLIYSVAPKCRGRSCTSSTFLTADRDRGGRSPR